MFMGRLEIYVVLIAVVRMASDGKKFLREKRFQAGTSGKRNGKRIES